MKNFVYALAALSLTAGGAMAASSSDFTTATKPAQTVEVPAGDVMTSRELAQAGLKSDDMVTITRVNTTEETASIDNSSRGFY